MKEIVIIGIATVANLNMKKDAFFSRRDFLKTAGTAIATTLMVACGADGLQTPVSNSDNNGSAKEIIPTPDLLLKVEAIFPQDVDVLFKGHEEEYAQLGVSKEDVTGGYFEGSFLFHFVDKDGFDYFYLNRGSTAEPKNTFEPLDFGIDQNGNYFLGPKLSTYGTLKPEPDQVKEYFIWNPNKETVSGELLITYQTDGTSDTALLYRLPDQNPIKHHLEGRAKIRQESPEWNIPQIEGLTHKKNAFIYDAPDGRNLTIAEESVGKELVDGILKFGVWDLEIATGNLIIKTNGAPQSETELSTFRTMIIVEGHELEYDMINTIHLANNEALQISDDFNEKTLFGNITVNDEDHYGIVKNVDVRPQTWEVKLQNGNRLDIIGLYPVSAVYTSGNRFYSRNRAAMPERIVLDRGYFNIQRTDKNGKVLGNYIHVPAVFMDTNRSIIPFSAIAPAYELENIIKYFNEEMYPYLSAHIIIGEVNPSLSTESEEVLVSDPTTRKFLTHLNRPFVLANLEQFEKEGPLPKNINMDVFLDLVHVKDLDR